MTDEFKNTEDRLDDISAKATQREELALTFRETVLLSLQKISDNLSAHNKANDEFIKESRADRDKIKECTNKIPGIETSLGNHLKSHDSFRKYLMYPIGVVLLCGFGALIWQLVIKHF